MHRSELKIVMTCKTLINKETCLKNSNCEFNDYVNISEAPSTYLNVCTHKSEYIDIELIGPLPKNFISQQYIVTMNDHFSKWPDARVRKDKTAEGGADFLYQTMKRNGCPVVQINDYRRGFF